jgi:PAS domain S-box-containing protein
MSRPGYGLLDTLLAQTTDGVFVINGEGAIVLWNRAAEKILGYTGREVIGQPCCHVFMDGDDTGNRLCYRGCHVTSLVTIGNPGLSFDLRTRTKSGQTIWVNVSALPWPNGPTGPLTAHLFRDVTVTKELLRAVQQQLAGAGAPTDSGAALTRRELAVLRLLATGANTTVLAEQLHVSRATIRNHVQNIFGKLGVHSRLQVVAYAISHRML